MLCVIVSHFFPLLCRIPMCEHSMALFLFFASSAVSGALEPFPFWAIAGGAALPFHPVSFGGAYVRISVACDRGVNLPGQGLCICRAVADAAKWVSKMVVPINTSPGSI